MLIILIYIIFIKYVCTTSTTFITMAFHIHKQICLNCINNISNFSDVSLSASLLRDTSDADSSEYYFTFDLDLPEHIRLRTIAELRDDCCVNLGINLNDKDNYSIAYDVTMWNSRRIGDMEASVSEYVSIFLRATRLRFLCSHFLAMTTRQEDE